MCSQIFESPIILPCGETICLKCIPANINQHNCKFCHRIHEIPREGLIKNILAEKVALSYQSRPRISKEVDDKINLIKARLDELKNELENSEYNIMSYCANIIKEIDSTYNSKIDQIKNLKNELIGNVVEYEKSCLISLDSCRQDHLNLIEKINFEIQESANDLNQDSDSVIKNLENLKSKLSIEKFLLNSFKFNFLIFEFVKNTNSVDQNFLGKFQTRKLEPIEESAFKKVTLNHVISNGNFKIEIKKLNDYFLIAHGKDEKLNLKIFDGKNVLHEKILDSMPNQNFEIFIKNNWVYLIFNASLLKLDDCLKKKKQVNLSDPSNCFVVTDKNVLVQCISEINGPVLNVYDINLNYLMQLTSKTDNCFIHVPGDFSIIYSNENYLFFRGYDSISVVDLNNGKLMKKFLLPSCFEIFDISDENVIYAKVIYHSKPKIVLMNFDGKICVIRHLDGFSDQIKIFLNDEKKFEFFDPQKLNLYFYY
ncbi:unnamed protein product [Brachionus calyciflorus]|uniref:Uncharacterized protein n=1 Tax=Brachionus calyciflorus TaxID=104777 RepID=A0A813MR33_9BILA|nr:unnamed protein product [Brachionus calyciflorus]